MKGSEVLVKVVKFLAREQRATTSALHGALGIPDALLNPALAYLLETGRVVRIKAMAKPGEELDDYGLPLGGPDPTCGGTCSCSGQILGVQPAEVWVWKG